MLASCRLHEPACSTFVARVIKHPVIGIVSHLIGMVERVYVRLLVLLCAEIYE